MAHSHPVSQARRTRQRSTPRGTCWMSERQLDAYLEAREALRRISHGVLLTKARQPGSPPSVAPPSSS